MSWVFSLIRYVLVRILRHVYRCWYQMKTMGFLRNVSVNAVNVTSQYQKMFHLLTRKKSIRRKYIHFNLYQFWGYIFQSRVYTLSSVSFYDMAHIIEQEISFYCKNIKLRQRIRMTIFTKHKMIFICILQNACHTESKVFIFIAYLKFLCRLWIFNWKSKLQKHRLIVASENHIKSFDEYPYKV